MASFLARTAIPAAVSKPQTLTKLLKLTPVVGQAVRNLNVQEHVSYTLLNESEIPTPRFAVANTKKDAHDIATKLKTDNLVLKAQVLAGGRGKGHFKSGLQGGVRVVYDPKQAEEIASKMLNQLLITKQTGEAGRMCTKVMVTERKFPRREFYFAVMLERAFNGPVLIASSQGGVDIEEVAATNPTAILYEPINISEGLTREQACRMIEKVGLGGENADEHINMLLNMYKLFVCKDALLIEINPYAEDALSGFFALDAKFRFDDNAEFRQQELFAMRDWTQEDPKEVEAAKYNLNYIALDGTIGCMVNGAGLAMATMDIIKLYGGEPANFLDVGGGATAEAVKQAFKIITSDPKVLCILVNIFGGIMRCDIIAQGIIAAAQELNLKMPVVVRLQGTKVEEARDLIKKSNLKILARHDLDEAADLTVHLAQIVKLARSVKMDVNFEIPDAAKNGGGDSCDEKEEKKDPCGKKEEKKDPCAKKEEKKDPCPKKEEKKDPCAKKEEKKDPCPKKEEKKDPCAKKEEKKDPCPKKEEKKDPCAKKEEKKDPCPKKDEKKDPCAKKDDPSAKSSCLDDELREAIAISRYALSMDTDTEALQSYQRVREANAMRAYVQQCSQFLLRHLMLANLAVKRQKGPSDYEWLQQWPQTVAQHILHSQSMIKRQQKPQKKVFAMKRASSMQPEVFQAKMNTTFVPNLNFSGTAELKKINSTPRKQNHRVQWKSIPSTWKNQDDTK